MSSRIPPVSSGYPYDLPPFDAPSKTLNVVIETIQGSPNKLKLDPSRGIFRLAKVLPVGSVFPYDFGFVPSTLCEDGDPMDVLVIMDAPTHPGCIVPSRILGVIEAMQTNKGKKPVRNDRIIAVSDDSSRYQGISTLRALGSALLDEIEHFFEQYNLAVGRKFEVLGRRGPTEARRLIDAAAREYVRSSRTREG